MDLSTFGDNTLELGVRVSCIFSFWHFNIIAQNTVDADGLIFDTYTDNFKYLCLLIFNKSVSVMVVILVLNCFFNGLESKISLLL